MRRKRALRDTLPAYRASDSDITVDVSWGMLIACGDDGMSALRTAGKRKNEITLALMKRMPATSSMATTPTRPPNVLPRPRPTSRWRIPGFLALTFVMPRVPVPQILALCPTFAVTVLTSSIVYVALAYYSPACILTRDPRPFVTGLLTVPRSVYLLSLLTRKYTLALWRLDDAAGCRTCARLTTTCRSGSPPNGHESWACATRIAPRAEEVSCPHFVFFVLDTESTPPMQERKAVRAVTLSWPKQRRSSKWLAGVTGQSLRAMEDA